MDAVRPEHQRMGDNVPERAHFAERKPVSGGLSEILWGATNMEGLKGQPILQKSWRKERRCMEAVCDVYGENLVKATLPGGGWTYHLS